MSEILAGFGILGFLLAWNFLWRPTLLDDTRDRLFDLRDAARAWFVKNGYGLAHPAYLELRGMLNASIRYTEKLSLAKFMAFRLTQKNSKTSADALSDVPQIAEYANSVLRRRSDILFSYMFQKNLFLCPVWACRSLFCRPPGLDDFLAETLS